MHLRLRYLTTVTVVLAVTLVMLGGPPVLAQERSAKDRLAEYYGTGCGKGEVERVLRQTRPALAGSDVLELQTLLKAHEYDPGPLDGVFGPRTGTAVVRFQQRQGISGDGTVSEATWQSLAGAFSVSRPARTELPPPQGEVLLVVDAPTRTLTVVANGVPYASFPVAVGTAESPTPAGEWRVVEKSSGWGGGFGVRWLGLNVPWGTYGIHGTNKPWSIGRSLSAGCIRMHNSDVTEVWEWVPLGTRVIVLGPPLHIPDWAKEPAGPGAEGWVVVEIQRRLRGRGFDVGALDGRYGAQTEQAVRGLQRAAGLPETGRVGEAVYQILGL